MAKAGVAFGSVDLTSPLRRDVVMTSTFQSSHATANDSVDEVVTMEPDLATTGHMTFVDGRCACCPYGYHIDIDFLRYLDSLGKSTDATDSVAHLQRISDNKRRLRESMELYLRRRELEAAGGGDGMRGRDDVDLEHESSRIQSLVEREDQLTSRYLESIDSSLFRGSSGSGPAPRPKYRSEAALHVSRVPGQDNDSSSSVSIHSGPPSPSQYHYSTGELVPTGSRRGPSPSMADWRPGDSYPRVQNGAHGGTMSMMEKTMTSKSMVTGGGVTDDVETILVDGVVNPGHPGIPADMTLISSATLQTIREQMAASLRRMKQLEDENNALRMLEARMSVLKEEKKMMEIQTRSRQTPLTRSVGVGDCTVDEFDTLGRAGGDQQRPQNGADVHVVRKLNLSPLPVVSKKSSRDVGVGDGDVFAVETAVTDVGPVRIHEREVSTEQNTEVKEKEIKTVFLGGGTGDIAPVIGAAKPKQTRSIGVGDDKVFEVSDAESSSVQVHEKELRTVYIGGGAGGAAPAPKSTRNVGILCKTAMREVGVMYHCDDAAPMTRSIAVGVGEMGVSDNFELAERSDSSVHVTNMALQQLNMAAFQSRHLRFSNEQLREVLDLMLKKNLRSVAVQCRFATVDRGVSTTASAADMSVSVGCSDDTVDVDVLPVRQFRSVAIDCRPSVFHRACGADFVYRVDSATNTRTQGIRVDRGSNTDTVVKYPAATNTEGRLSGETVSTETEPMMFESAVSGAGDDVGLKTGQMRTTVTREVKKTSSSLASSLPSSSSSAAVTGGGAVDVELSKASSAESSLKSSDLARQKKRDSMLFGDVDEPPLIVAGGEHYHAAHSDSTLSTSSTSVSTGVSGGSSSQLVMPSRTVSEPAFSQTTSSSSRESFVSRSDEALVQGSPRPRHSDDMTRQMTYGLESSDGDGSGDTLGSVVWRGAEMHPGTITQSTATQSRGSSGGGGGGRQVYVTETRIERRRGGPDVSGAVSGTSLTSDVSGIMSGTSQRSDVSGVMSGGFLRSDVTGTVSEGSLRSIMKSSSSSDKDSTSPTVTRRRISFIDSAEHKGETGDTGSDSQRSSASYEEGTYDGQQGSVTYSCRDDVEMMKSAAASGSATAVAAAGGAGGGAVMYDQRYQQTYVMSAEMSSACATYAQWLDDSTQVAAKDLNASVAVVQRDWFSVSSNKLVTVAQVETMLTAVRDISQSLLEHIVNMADTNGNAALHYAVSHGNFDIVSLLLDTGVVDVDQSNRAGYTAVMLASLADVQTDTQRNVVLRLFRAGNVNLQALQAGQTALMLAVSHGRLDLVQLLLEAGADVNVQDEDGSTALMCASEHGHVELVKLLLSQANCDANIADNDGSTAMSIAMEAGHRDVGVMLYAHVNYNTSSPKVTRKTVSTHTTFSISRK